MGLYLETYSDVALKWVTRKGKRLLRLLLVELVHLLTNSKPLEFPKGLNLSNLSHGTTGTWWRLPLTPLRLSRADQNWNYRTKRILAPRVGLEPTTRRLTAGCSTAELSGNV
jgi:hypothetical protein